MKKVILITLTSILFAASAQATEWLKTRFAELDTDGNGYLNKTEMRGTTKQWMDEAGMAEQEQIKRTNKKLVKLDTNSDGQVSVDEFISDHQKNKKK
ncbi:EF-hand domain-containing protein [Thalassotalea crassostreae]|uniref:EF-hand domain-containing protein n=1 Tax=Thalassotalea crassostreae TaxID=1763536 RepID=UPI000837AF1C|nr:EF-hand domain-containing protein [Thalassotalea crassostreae]